MLGPISTFLRLLAYLIFGMLVPLVATAQSDGLPGGPMRPDVLRDIQKVATICDKCRNEQAVYHAAVDHYDAARATYEAGMAEVRRATDAFLAARQKAAEIEATRKAAEDLAHALLFDRPEGTSLDTNAYNEANWAEEEAYEQLVEAQGVLARARAELDAKLRALEPLREQAVAAMRAALRLQSAMHQCELQCDVAELDLDEPIETPPPVTPGTIPASAIPTPENFLGVVAKCAECQPFAKQVNQIRAHRRGFAVDAQWTHESLTRNHATLERLGHEARDLLLQEQALYRHLLASFSPSAPPESADWIDQRYDQMDQAEAEAALRSLRDKRAQNMRDQEGLARTIETQTRALLEALANYQLHTLLLEAARKRLAECEENCPATAVDGPKTSLYDPAYPVPENFGPILAACPECQPLADELARIMSARREVAHDIQFDVQMLKHARRMLEHAISEDAKLAREERLMGQILRVGAEGGANEDAALDRLWEIDGERFRLLEMRLRAEENIADYEARIEENQAKHQELTVQINALRAQLEICNFNCNPEAEGNEIGLGGGTFDPAWPQPEKYQYATTDCPECQDHVDALNRLMLNRYILAHEIQSTVAELKTHRAKLAEQKAALAALDTREAEVSPVGTNPLDPAIRPQLDAIDTERRVVERQIASTETVIETTRTRLREGMRRHASLSRAIEAVRGLIASCEAKCTSRGDDTATGLGQDPTYGQDDFVSTDCPPCAALASLVNDAVGSAIAAERALAEAKQRLRDLTREQTDRETGLNRLSARERALNEEWLTSADADRQAEIDTELHEVDGERHALEDARAAGEIAQSEAVEVIEAAEATFDAANRLVAELKAQLTECEKQCAPAEDGGAIAVHDPAPFVRTDCAPCEALASMVNDAVGTLIGADRDLKAAQDKLAGIQSASAKRQTRLGELETHEANLNEEWLTSKDEGRRNEIDAELHRVDAERHGLEDAEELAPADTELAEQEVTTAQARVDELTRQVADLKAQLAECEKQCAPTDEDTNVALNDDPSPFVRTDCAPCEVLASLVNDAVGTLIGAERDRDAARAALTALDTAATARAEALAGLEAREAALNEEWLTSADDARKAEIDQELHGVDAERHELEEAEELAPADRELAQQELETAQARVDELTQQVATLKAQLAECEKQCAPAEDGSETALDDGQPQTDPRFASTDCAPCAQIVSLLNDAIGSAITTERLLGEAQTRLDTLRGRVEALEADKRAAQDAFTEALVERARLEDAGQDTSAAQEIIDRESARAADLLGEIDAFAFDLLTQEEAVADLSTLLERWRQQEAVLRAQLEECEKQCEPAEEDTATAAPDPEPEPEPVALTPEMLLDKLQPDQCRAGRGCGFEISLSNQGNAPLPGPVFLSETQRVDAGANGTDVGGWHCSPAGGGRSLCLYPDPIVPGAGSNISITVRLPGWVARGTENCIELVYAVDDRALVRMVQVGLAARGLNPGIADGIPGRRTRAAVAALSEQLGREIDPEDMAAVYEALYGRAPNAQGAPGKACTRMDVINPPRRTTPAPAPAQTAPPAEPEPPVEQPRTRPRIIFDFGIDLGLGRRRGGRDHEGGTEEYSE